MPTIKANRNHVNLGETRKLLDEVTADLWKKQSRAGKPNISEGVRYCIMFTHKKMIAKK